MKRRLWLILIGIALLLAIGGYSYSNLFNSNPSKKLADPAITVTAIPVIQKDVTVQIQAVGTVNAFSTVAIKSRVEGQLLTVNFKEGDTVRTGDILFTIDPKPYQVALQQVQAKLASDQAQLDNARLVLQRNEPLVKKGYVSSQDYDQFKANVEAFEGTVEADKAAIASAQLQLSYCTIISPIDGRTGNLLVYPGNLVKANDVNPLVTINQIKPIYVAFSVPEQYLAIIQRENSAGALTITVSDKKGKRTSQGKLSFIDNTVDTSTGTIQLKATFPNTDERLWPGEYVNVSIPTHSLSKALLIPTQAIQLDQQNNPYVFVINQDSRVSIRSIKTKHSIANDSIVTQGLKAGELVVTTGQLHLINGAKVTQSVIPSASEGSSPNTQPISEKSQ